MLYRAPITHVLEERACLLKVDHIQHAFETICKMRNLDEANHQSICRVNELQFLGGFGALLLQ